MEGGGKGGRWAYGYMYVHVWSSFDVYIELHACTNVCVDHTHRKKQY